MTVLLLAPTALGAEQLDYGLRSGVAWTQNVFGVAEDVEVNGRDDEPVDDFSARLSPFVAVSDPGGDLTWSLRYQPSYEHYLEQTELSGLDQELTADAAWRFADRWSVRLQETYAIYQNTVRFNEAAAPGEEVALGFQEQEVRSNRTTAVLRHLLSPRDSLFLNLTYHLYEFPDGGNNDRSIPSVALAYQHVLSERTTLGARLSGVQQTYERTAADSDQTRFYNLAATLEHRFSRTLRLEASAGPTLVDSTPATEFEPLEFGVRRISFLGGPIIPVAVDATTCAFGGIPGRASISNYNGCGVSSDNILTPEEVEVLSKLTTRVPTLDEQGSLIDTSAASSTDLTYFARLALLKEWENWSGSLTYERANSESARFGSSSVADTLGATLNWRPRPLWSFTLAVALGLQEQASDQVIPSQFVVVNAPAPAGITSVDELAQVQSIIGSLQSGAEEYRTQSASLTATRQLTQHAFAFATLSWYSQQLDSELSDDQTRWKNLTLWVGLEWKFDPIRF